MIVDIPIPHISPSKSLQIAFCLPELKLLEEAANSGLDAAYLQQMYISSGLQARGHRLTFLAPRHHKDMVYTPDLRDMKLAPRSWTKSRWFDLVSRGTWRLQRGLGIPYMNVFSNYRYFDACMQALPGHDIIYERNGLNNAGVAMACRRLKLPYVMFFDADQIMELDFLGRPITGLLRQRAINILRYNLSVASCVICVSEQSKVNLETKWGMPYSKIVVFPNAVDVERFKPHPEMRTEVRNAYGLGSNFVIIFVGNFYKWHDLATLLNAFSKVLKMHPDSRLILVGDGPERQATVQLANELGISKAVHFTGLVAHGGIPGLISASDVAVVPVPQMINELWLSPMKLFEYMASGAAIVASGVGQVVEVIRDGENGLLVPPGDATAMVSSFSRLIIEPDLRLRLGTQAREDAITKHSWDQYISRIEQLFFGILTA